MVWRRVPIKIKADQAITNGGVENGRWLRQFPGYNRCNREICIGYLRVLTCIPCCVYNAISNIISSPIDNVATNVNKILKVSATRAG